MSIFRPIQPSFSPCRRRWPLGGGPLSEPGHVALLRRLEPAPIGGRAGGLRGGKNLAIRLSLGLGRAGPAAKVAIGKTAAAGVAEGLALGVAVLAGMLLLYFLGSSRPDTWPPPRDRSRPRPRRWAWAARPDSSSAASCCRRSTRCWKSITGGGSSSAACGDSCRSRPRWSCRAWPSPPIT